MNTWHHLPDIYFLHIPKTAGTSIRTWLIDLFPDGALLPADHLLEMEALPESAIRDARLASGHFGWRLVERAERIGKHFEVITFLRDVVSLRMSTLGYVTRLTEAEVAALDPNVAEETRRSRELAHAFDLAQYVRTATFDTLPLTLGEEHKHSQNVYVHYLAGHGTQAEPLLAVNEESYSVAARRLDGIAFAGIVNEMDWSIALLCERFGLPLLPMGGRENVSANPLIPSADYAVACLNWDSYAQKLYEKAEQRLEARKLALGARFALPADAAIGDFGDAMRQAFLDTDRGIAKISQAEISMADGVICEGFGQRSYYRPLGRQVRWAGPGTSSRIYLPLDAADARRIRIGIAATMNMAIRDNLAMFVNNKEVPLQRSYEVWEDGEYHLVCAAVIPQEIMRVDAQYTALEFRVPEVVATAPADVEFMGPAVSFALADIRID